MSDIKDNISVYILKLAEYPQYREAMHKLYIDVFTKGEFAQYIDKAEAQHKIDKIMRIGFAIVAINSSQLVGFSLFTSLAYDEEFPPNIFSDYEICRSLYISEVLVSAKYRGRGIATRMIDYALNEKYEEYSQAVIRVWENNRPALLLYEKIGFVPIVTISQSKFRTKDEEFEMKKIYLSRLI